MIKRVVIHLVNEQPLLADLDAAPKPSDGVLVCTNLRTMNGTRPVFIDNMESTFVFPYAQVRFIEIPRQPKAGKGTRAAPEREPVEAPREPEAVEPPPEPEGDLEIDEDFLRRIREI